MPERPKPNHIPLPPSPEPPRPPERRFVIPRPSPSINSGIFDNPSDDYSLAEIKRTIGGLQTAVEQIQRGAVAIHQNEMKTEPARHAEALDYGFKVLKPALMATDATAARLHSELATLRAKTSTPPPIRDVLAAEIRTALRNMKPTERTAAVMAAAKAGDDSFVSAVLSAPSLLSGMTATQHEHLRKSYGAVRFPEEVKRIEALENAMVHRGSRQLFGAHLQLVCCRPDHRRPRRRQPEARPGGDRGSQSAFFELKRSRRRARYAKAGRALLLGQRSSGVSYSPMPSALRKSKLRLGL